MGYLFADSIAGLAAVLSDASLLLVAGLATAILGYALLHVARRR
jgi:hypothetical protein